ncbi:MAG: DUF4118 domain-containing protein [Armatimonadetes bacterium]|nr:DUF4118 domain-containing protein [Armatimonadota bacterium]
MPARPERIWRKSYPYAVAIFGPLVITSFRWSLDAWIGDKLSYLFYVLPVCIAALSGGIWPGLLATLVGVLLGRYFFVEPRYTFTLTESAQAVTLFSSALTWAVIALIADAARSKARSERLALKGRKESESFIAEVLYRITDGFFMVNNRWEVTVINRAMSDLLGLPSEVAIGRNIWELPSWSGKYASRDYLEEAMKNGTPGKADIENPVVGKWFRLRMYPDVEREAMAVFVADITAEKQLELAQSMMLADERAARSDAEHENRLKDTFVATLSHELRTPLTAIIGWTEILLNRVKEDPELQEGLASIDRSARLQAHLIEDLLDMSRIVTGRLALEWEIVDLREVVDEVLRQQLPIASEGQKSLGCTHCEEDLLMRGDGLRLHQIITNLVANAIKFTDRSGSIELFLERDGDEAILTVQDNGQGIDAQSLPHIFDWFRQANSTTSRKHSGLGLGLAIVNQLVRSHGGTVFAESAGLGKGAKFTVRLPLVQQRLQRNPMDMEQASSKLDGVKVLLLEDDDLTRRMMEKVLTLAGAEVTGFANGQDAWKSIGMVKPHVLVSDIGMPGMDGYEFIKLVRKSEDHTIASTPAIAVSAFARKEDHERALASGFNAHIPKPIAGVQFIEEISRLCRLGSFKY